GVPEVSAKAAENGLLDQNVSAIRIEIGNIDIDQHSKERIDSREVHFTGLRRRRTKMLEQKLQTQSVDEDIQKLVNVVTQVGRTIEGVKPSDPALEQEFKALTEEFGKVRGRPLYWNFVSDGVGRGPYIACKDGSV